VGQIHLVINHGVNITKSGKLMTEKLDKHTEFETKYRVEGNKVYEFTKLVQSVDKEYDFIYVQGSDHYYTKPDGSFLRYRKGETDKSGRAEVTLKQKPVGAANNAIRKEVNWRVDRTPFDTIQEGALMMGYKFNFRIYKTCHIYKFKDATLVFYTVFSDDDKMDHFIEIELDEETIGRKTEAEAWATIKTYEAILSPLGITYRNRLDKSLYEMYVKPMSENVVELKQKVENV
jgi:hypothetical protein